MRVDTTQERLHARGLERSDGSGVDALLANLKENVDHFAAQVKNERFQVRVARRVGDTDDLGRSKTLASSRAGQSSHHTLSRIVAPYLYAKISRQQRMPYILFTARAHAMLVICDDMA